MDSLLLFNICTCDLFRVHDTGEFSRFADNTSPYSYSVDCDEVITNLRKNESLFFNGLCKTFSRLILTSAIFFLSSFSNAVFNVNKYATESSHSGDLLGTTIDTN